MPYVERSILINGSIQAVFDIASNMERYPEFMPDVESVVVIKREGNRTVTEWETTVDGTPILWTEEDLFYREQNLITYKLIEGDLDKFEGEWRFVANEDNTQTEVTLTVDYDFGIPELTNLIGPTLQQKVGENSDMMLQGMKQRIETR